MKFGVFTENGSFNSLPVFNSVLNGLLKQGHEVVQNSMDVDVPVIWSLLWHGRMAPNKTIWETFHSQNKKVLVIEVGNIKRNHTWKVGIDGINRKADFGPKNNGPAFFEKTGSVIIILLPILIKKVACPIQAI